MRFKVSRRAAAFPVTPNRWLVYLESTRRCEVLEFASYLEAIAHAHESSQLDTLLCVEVSDCLGRVLWAYTKEP